MPMTRTTDETGELYQAIEEKAERIQADLDALNESLAVPYPDDLELAGAIVTIDHEGKLRIERNLIRKEDMKKLSSGVNEQGLAGSAGTGKADEPKPVHSEKLTRMLTAHRTAAIQAVMANRPEVALAALVHRMALQVFGSGYCGEPDRAGQHRNTASQARCGEHRGEPRGQGNGRKAPVLAGAHRGGGSRMAKACSGGCWSKTRRTCTICWPSVRRPQSIRYRAGKTGHQMTWRRLCPH